MFLVLYQDGDFTLGFEGYPSHTHGDILAAESGLPPQQAVTAFISALLAGKALIAVSTVEGTVRNVWVAIEPVEPNPYRLPNETITYRRWDGTVTWIDGVTP